VWGGGGHENPPTWSQDSAAVQMVPSFFKDVKQHRLVISCPHFLSNYLSHLSGSASPLKIGTIGFGETSVTNYESTLRNILEERIFQKHTWITRFFSHIHTPILYITAVLLVREYLDLIWYDMLTAIWLPPGDSSTQYTFTQNNTQNNTKILEECGPCPVLASFYPGICLTTEEKAWKNLSQGSRTIRIHRPNNKNI
jgi:hypothetical protein